MLLKLFKTDASSFSQNYKILQNKISAVDGVRHSHDIRLKFQCIFRRADFYKQLFKCLESHSKKTVKTINMDHWRNVEEQTSAWLLKCS